MTTKLKKITSLFLAVIMSLALVSCSAESKKQGSNSETGLDSSTGTSDEATNSGEKIKLIHWSILNPTSTSDPRNVALKEIVEDWNATNKWGAEMVVESISWTDIVKQTVQAAAAGVAPDVLLCYSNDLNNFLSAGAIIPMTDYAKEWISETDDYIFSADDLTLNGEIYCLPWETRAIVLYYRTDIYGQESPFTNLEKLKEVAGAQTINNILGYCISLKETDKAESFFESFMPIVYAFGGECYDDDYHVVLNSEGVVKAVEYVKDLYDSGVINDSVLSMNYDDVQNGLKSGTIYSAMLGSHRYGSITGSEQFGDSISTTAVPGPDGGIAPAYVTSQTMAIGSFTEYPEIAFDFIKSNLTVDSQLKYFNASCLPVRSSVLELDEAKKSQMYNNVQKWLEIFKTGTIRFFPSYHTELQMALASTVQDMVINGSDIQSGLDALVEQYN